MIKKGDRVRLTPAMTNVMMKGVAPHSRMHRVDWNQRIGTVQRDHYCGGQITVKWDDRKSWEQWPPKALEKINDIS